MPFFSVEAISLVTAVIGLIGYLVKTNAKIRNERDDARRELGAAIAKSASSEKASVRQMVHLMQRQNNRCALTGIELKYDNAKIDRIKSTVGDYNNGSVQILLREVAAMKAAITGDQRRFIELCCAVADYSGEEEE